MKKENFFRRHLKLIIILIVIAAIVAAALAFLQKKAKESTVGEVKYLTDEVTRTNVTQNLSGSGSLTAANSYTVSGLYSGEIISANFEEGDTVEKDQVLYVIDSSSSDTEEKRNVTSSASGYVYSLNVKVGDDVKQGQQVATVVSADNMELTVPFSAIDAEGFYVGQAATVVLDNSFEELTGTVKNVSGLAKIGEGNIQTRDVTISVKNQGALGTNQYASASVGGSYSMETACFEYASSVSVTAEASGTVSRIYANEGSAVSNGQTILYLAKSDDTLRELSSPISGTVVDKAYKAGENAESGAKLCTIYDLSYLEMTLSIDELDIAEVHVGQKVQVTADATPGVTYEGEVTKVSVAGSSYGGTATFPVTIRISEFGDLLPSMNADAVIVLEGVENVLAVPNSAVQRGNMVMLTADSPTAKAAVESGKATADETTGYVYVEVETGLSDDDMTEIKSGLQEGDTVVYTVSSSNGFQNMMPGGFGDMPSGGFPSGGSMPSGGGGMPSGGGSRPSGGGPGGF